MRESQQFSNKVSVETNLSFFTTYLWNSKYKTNKYKEILASIRLQVSTSSVHHLHSNVRFSCDSCPGLSQTTYFVKFIVKHQLLANFLLVTCLLINFFLLKVSVSKVQSKKCFYIYFTFYHVFQEIFSEKMLQNNLSYSLRGVSVSLNTFSIFGKVIAPPS